MSCRLLAAASGLLLSLSCTAPPKQPATNPSSGHSYWIGDGVQGSPRMVINLTQQRIFYFKGDRLVGVAPISSGRESHATRTGSYRITEKDMNHRSSLYGDYVAADGSVVRADVDVRKDARPPQTRFVGAGMRYFMRITGAIGMHEGYLPGYPASHGCIRLPTRMAASFFHATPLGTPVQITGHASAAPPQPAIPLEMQESQAGKLADARQPAWQAKKASASASKKTESKPTGKVRIFERSRKPPPIPRGTTLYLNE